MTKIIEEIETHKLKPYEKNPRTHSAKQITQIVKSIDQFGFTVPLLIDEDNMIIAGHGRLSAAKEAKIETVPCIRASHLSDAQKRAYIIADNKLTENGGWDETRLKEEFQFLDGLNLDFDLDITGFEIAEIDIMLDNGMGDDSDDDLPDLDPDAPVVTKLGDVWTLGDHKLIAIPVRDVDGHIASILIRNAKPIERNGKVTNKYVAFSSAGKDKGAKVWQTTHCPIVKGLPRQSAGTTVRITEGVLKADIATALGDIYCLGMQGLKLQSDFEQIIEELEISELRICIDAGEDENIDIIRCRADIINRATKAGIDVKVELWDAKLGKGLDDVLHAGHGDKIRIATEEEVDSMLAVANSKNPNNGEYIYVISAERFISTLKNQVLKKSQFADKFQLEKTEHVNQIIASGFPQVDTITFWPGKEKILTENSQTALNEWRDPGIIPVQGDIDIFINHLKYLLGKEYSIILDWLAFQTQYPGEKILWMPVIIGGQGIGKSFLGRAMVNLFGKENVKFPMNEQLEEKFNNWQRKVQIVVIEELMAKGKIGLMNKLKPLITEPLTEIRLMGTDSFSYPNRFNMIGFTNYNNALKLEVDDRRYCVLKSNAIPRDDSYYALIWAWLQDHNNIQALLYNLLKRDLNPLEDSKPY